METLKFEKLEIMQDDLPNKMTWDDAYNYANELGDNWRLPENEEFSIILKLYHLRIGGFKPERYWANTSKSTVGWYHDLNVGYSPHITSKNDTLQVRLVRSI
jgi:hypothetical protein